MIAAFAAQAATPLLVLATAALAQTTPTCADRPGNHASTSTLPVPDSASLARTLQVLTRWPRDVVTISSARDSLEASIDGSLREVLGVDAVPALVYVIKDRSQVTGRDRGAIRHAAAHFYLRLGLPQEYLHNVLLDPGVHPQNKGFVYFELSMTAAEGRKVGPARTAMICDLVQRLSKGQMSGVDNRELLSMALRILLSQAQRSNADAQRLLEDPLVRHAIAEMGVTR